MSSRLRFVVNVLVLVSVCGLCSCAGLQQGRMLSDEAAFMGDWQGSQMLNYSTKSPLVAQVIAMGGGKFQANLLPEFDKDAAPIAVLDGQLEGRTVVFEPNEANSIQWDGAIKGGKFNGSFRGTRWGSFEMAKVV